MESNQGGSAVRPGKDEYFMVMAQAASGRATCKRRKVGAVLVRDGHIVSTGYNGSPEGLEHCLEVGCEMEGGHCVRCVHAEANAIIQAGVMGASTADTTMYTTASPCRYCMGLIINARIKRVVYCEQYKDPQHEGDKARWALDVAARLGIAMVYLPSVPRVCLMGVDMGKAT